MTSSTTPELDQLASLARTALTDPAGLPVEVPDDDESGGTAPEIAYGVEQLDALTETLNPSAWTPLAAATATRCLARHLAVVMDELGGLAEEMGATPAEARRYRETASALDVALDALDVPEDEPGE